MNLRRFAAVLGCALGCLVGARTAHAATPATDESRQVLLMLRTPAVHARPDAGYVADYERAPGHAARARLARRLAEANGLTVRTDWPMPALGLDCYVLQAADGRDVPRAIATLAKDPRVESVQAMQVFETLGDRDAARDPLAAAQPTRAAWHLDALHAVTTGKGVTVAVVDSGIADAHPDLRGQIAAHRDFVDDANAARSVPERHGTEVAGLIAARANNRVGIAGVAPDAKLLGLRACWQSEGGGTRCNSFTLAKALQFAIDRRAGVINLSLGGPRDGLLTRLLGVAMQRGATIVAAVDPNARDGGFPASLPGVVAVAGDRSVALPFPAFLAPADGLPTTTVDGGWGLVGGTSFAAAGVSGLVALLRQGSPRLSPARVRDALGGGPALGSAPTRPLPIDACAAVARAGPGCACACRLADSRETPRH